jgi:hypothetical protein
MKIKVTIVALFLCLVAVGIFVWLQFNKPATQANNPAPATTSSDYENGTYNINGVSVTLMNGRAETALAPGSASTLITQYFGDESSGRLDGQPYSVFLITQSGGGSGTFYYVAAALESPGGYVGTNAILLGDRIAPQTIEINNGEAVVNFADRKPGDPMTAQPSVGVSKYFRIINGQLTEVNS